MSVSSYSISQSLDLPTFAWASAYALWSLLRTVAIILGLAIALGSLFAVVVAFWLPICQIAGCLAIVVAFGWATYPRTRKGVR